MQIPTLTAPESQNRSVFLALMDALSHPGRVCELDPSIGLSPHNMLPIGESLLDLETSFYASNPELAQALTATAASHETPENGEYQFYPVLTHELLEQLGTAPVGDMIYPDKGATLVIGCRFNCGPTLTLRGPGIQSEETIQVNSLPVELWDLRNQKIRYPLGWDIFLVHDNKIIGIPRTTEITVTG